MDDEARIALETCQLGKRFAGNELPAVHDISFSLQKGEILTLVGPSGCGKTTTLRLIAGFEQPDTGSIAIDGRPVADERRSLPPEKRGVGMVFQDYALFPHLSVWDNVAFGLAGRPRGEIQAETRRQLELLGMHGLKDRFPHELSGGERQRVALARALAPQPVVLLLDEPFSSLDADLRSQVRGEVRAILKEIGATAIFVTHDQEEALVMGDRLAVFNAGRLEQIDTPEGIFHCPQTRFVAEFMGQTDFLAGEVTPLGIQTEIGLLPQYPDLPSGAQVEIALRADDVAFEPKGDGPARILERQFRGALNIYRLGLPSGCCLHAFQPHTRILPPGTPVMVRADPGHMLACFYQGRAVTCRVP